MTTILDLPFECLSLDTVAKLGTLNKLVAEIAKKEYLLRNTGEELYKYLICNPEQVHKMSDSQLWSIIEYVLSMNKLPCYGMVFLLPMGPVRLSIQTLMYDQMLEYVNSAFITNDFQRIVPSLFSKRYGIFSTIQDAMRALHTRMTEISMCGLTNLPEWIDSAVDWAIDPVKFILVNLVCKRIYRSPNIQLSMHSIPTEPMNGMYNPYDEGLLHVVEYLVALNV